MAVKNDFEVRLNGEAIFPETCEDDWCGEFVPGSHSVTGGKVSVER